MSRQLGEAYSDCNGSYIHPDHRAGSIAHNITSSMHEAVRKPSQEYSHVSHKIPNFFHRSNAAIAHIVPPIPTNSATQRLTGQPVLQNDHLSLSIASKSARHENSQPRPISYPQSGMENPVTTVMPHYDHNANTPGRSPSERSFARRIEPTFTDWETFEQAIAASADPTRLLGNMLPNSSYNTSVVQTTATPYTKTYQQTSESLMVPSSQSYTTDTRRQASSHSGWYQPNVHTRPTEIRHPELACPECGKVFRGQYSRRNLDRHVKSQHDLIVFPCSRCSREYHRDDALLGHERKHHPELQRPPPIERKKSNESRKGSISPTMEESS